jgi:hypothetical protein
LNINHINTGKSHYVVKQGTEEDVKNHLTSDFNGHIQFTTDYAKRVGDQTVQCSRELQVSVFFV